MKTLAFTHEADGGWVLHAEYRDPFKNIDESTRLMCGLCALSLPCSSEVDKAIFFTFLKNRDSCQINITGLRTEHPFCLMNWVTVNANTGKLEYHGPREYKKRSAR